MERTRDSGRLPRRPYRDGIELSVIGLGGMLLWGMEQDHVDRTVAGFIERGGCYFDVAPTYGDSEERLGPALQPYREGVFLACKTTQRDAAGSQEELETSLRRLRTDHVDLYQFHGVSSMDDVEQILAAGGAGETFLRAKEQGKARYLGFSTHSEEAAVALMDRFPCDSVLMPVNFVCFKQGGFGPMLLEAAAERNVVRLSMKSIALDRRGRGDRQDYPKCWYRPLADPETARLALRFTLSQDVSATVPPGDEELFGMLVDLACDFEPITAEEQDRLMAHSEGVEPVFHTA